MPFQKGHPHGKRFKKGESGNPQGKAPGTKDYKTRVWDAICKIAASRNMKPEELEEELYKSGFLNSFKDFRYWNSHMDRVHGKAPLPLTGADGEDFKFEVTMNFVSCKPSKSPETSPTS